MMVNDRCTICGGGFDRRGVHICPQQIQSALEPLREMTQRSVFAHIMRRDEDEAKECVKLILQQMVCKIIEHVPINIDDRVEEIVDACRGLGL
jgi:hypothetical protein